MFSNFYRFSFVWRMTDIRKWSPQLFGLDWYYLLKFQVLSISILYLLLTTRMISYTLLYKWFDGTFNYLFSMDCYHFVFLERICVDRIRWCNFVSPWECKADEYLNEICPTECNLCNHDGNFTSAKKDGIIF